MVNGYCFSEYAPTQTAHADHKDETNRRLVARD